MSSRCAICNKTSQVGNRVSHSMSHSKRRWEPNLRRVHVNLNGTVKHILACTRCLRSNKVNKAAA